LLGEGGYIILKSPSLDELSVTSKFPSLRFEYLPVCFIFIFHPPHVAGLNAFATTPIVPATTIPPTAILPISIIPCIMGSPRGRRLRYCTCLRFRGAILDHPLRGLLNVTGLRFGCRGNTGLPFPTLGNPASCSRRSSVGSWSALIEVPRPFLPKGLNIFCFSLF
jgi:hypothetical protein